MEVPRFDETAPSAAAVRELIRLTDPAAVGASLVVADGDDMFAFSRDITGSTALGAMAYFRAGLSIVDAIDAVARWWFGGLDRVGSFLDFAGGYGRSTRFLVRHLAATKVCVAEIQPDALAFQARHFGVRPFVSTHDPAELEPDQPYDMVFAASLFTYLPATTFASWLRALWRFVAPGGVLAFSVHDVALHDLGVALVDGFAFVPSSEVASLSTDEYGTNVTTEAFVRARIAEAIGADAAEDAVRLPGGLCFTQDLWVVGHGPRRDHELTYEVGPSGALDEMRTGGPSWHLRGWAADPGYAVRGAVAHRIASVVVELNGEEVARATPELERPDVAEHFGRPDDPRLVPSGWECEVPSPRTRYRDVLTVVATCDQGKRFVLDATLVGDVLLRTARTPGTMPAWKRRVVFARHLATTRGTRVAVVQTARLARRRAGRALRRR